MAQTGLSSAIGLAIEATWRQVPLTIATGSKYNVGITATNPERFMIVEPGSGLAAKVDVLVPDNEIDGDVELQRTIKQAMTYDGSLSWKADGENLVYPLLGMLGRCVQSVAQAADTTHSPAVYQHVFTPNKYAPSFSVEEIFGDFNYGRLSSGVVFEKLELDFGKVVMAKASLIPYRQVPNVYPNSTNVPTTYGYGSADNIIPAQMSSLADGTKTWSRTASPAYCDVLQSANGNGPFVFGALTYGLTGGSFASAFLTYTDDSGTIQPLNADFLEGANLSFERKIDAQMVGGSGFDPGACTGSQFMTRGKASFLYKDTQVQLADIRHSNIGVNFKIVGSPIGTSGKTYLIDIYVPNAKLISNDGPTITDGPIVVSCDLAGRKVAGVPSCTVTLQTTFDISSLAGLAGSTGAAGGLGGWVNS